MAEEYATMRELREMAKALSEPIHIMAESIMALRTVLQIMAVAIAQQPNIDGAKMIKDVAYLIEGYYPQDEAVPKEVLAFHAYLSKGMAERGVR